MRVTKLPEHKVGTPGLMTEHAKNGYADQVRKRDVDFEGMYKDAEKEANVVYDRFEKAMVGIDPGLTWKEVLQKHPDDIEGAREEYNKQPWISALRKADLDPFYGEAQEYFCVKNGGREAFIDRQKKQSIVSFALLKDGVWYEKGEMGWWGITKDEKADWDDQFYKLFQELPDETLLSVVDCHI